MISLDITITLPDELASRAEAQGLLTPESLGQMMLQNLPASARLTNYSRLWIVSSLSDIAI